MYHISLVKDIIINNNNRGQLPMSKQKGSHSKESTLIDWPNSITIVSSGVANCRNLPFGERATRDSWVRLPRNENARSRHQVFLDTKTKFT